MEKPKAILKKIDFIGADLRPTFENNTIISTALGGFISGLMIIVMIVASGFFGQELFYRQKALVRNYSRVNVDSETNTSEFSTLFSIWTRSGINLSSHPDIFTEFNVSGYILRFDLNDLGVPVPSILPFPVVVCSSEIIGNEVTDYYKIRGFDVSLYWCMDLRSIPQEKRLVSKVLGMPGSSWINISVSMCDPATTLNCGWTLREYGNLAIGAGFDDKFVDISDFKNPVKEKLDTFLVPVSASLEAIMKISISRNTVLSDVGYIFSDQREEKFVSFFNYERNFSTINDATKQVMLLEFNADTKKNFTERQYLKVQEFLANMGGFFKGLLFISNLINYPNSFTSLVNQIADVESKHLQEAKIKIPFRVNKQNENPRVAENSLDEIASEVVKRVTHISVWEFMKNIFRCKFKENYNLKDQALICLDLKEMIRQKITVNALLEKIHVLESGSL